jgi:predicted RNA-binding protein YlxR (DUF448 family)
MIMAVDLANDEVREATGDGPERTCAVTRAKFAPDALIRFVRAPDGTITPDLSHRLPGRGVWVGLDRAIVDKAATIDVFSRSLKQPVRIPEDLGGLVDRLMLLSCTRSLSLTNKAGLVVAGFAKVESAVSSQSIAALVHASDAAEDGSAKLDGKLAARLARAGGSQTRVLAEDVSETSRPPKKLSRSPVIVTVLSGDELSLALGRENVVHAAIIKGGAARYFLNEVERLTRYRTNMSAAAGRPPRTRSNTEQV